MNFRDRNKANELILRSIYCVSNSKNKISYLGGAKTKNLEIRIKQELGENVGYYPQSRACKKIQPDILSWKFDIPFPCTLETQETFENYLKDCWEKDGGMNYVISGIEAKNYSKELQIKINEIMSEKVKEEVLDKVVLE